MSKDAIVEQMKQNFLSNTMEDIQSTFIPGLFHLKNFFNPRMLQTVNNFLLHTEDLPWRDPMLIQGKYFDNHRQTLTWFPHPVFEKLYDIFDNLTEQINTLFNTSCNFKHAYFWKDTERFAMKSHTDNPIIAYSLQIYLTKNLDSSFGTTFYHNDQEFMAIPDMNCGYLLDNSKEKIWHAPTRQLTTGITRYSLYAIWGNE